MIGLAADVGHALTLEPIGQVGRNGRRAVIAEQLWSPIALEENLIADRAGAPLNALGDGCRRSFQLVQEPRCYHEVRRNAAQSWSLDFKSEVRLRAQQGCVGQSER